MLKYKDVSESRFNSKSGINKLKKQQPNNLDFFCEKQVQASEEDILIDIDFSQQKDNNSPKNAQNLLDFPANQYQK